MALLWCEFMLMACGAMSRAGPGFTAQPDGSTNVAGDLVVFLATATGTATLTYQWQQAETDLPVQPRFTGTTSNVLSISDVMTADAGDYRLIVTDSTGSATSQVANLTVTVPGVVAGEIQIPDAALAAAIRVALKQPAGPLMSNDIAAMIRLSASGAGIGNLAGLEVATNLTSLCLSFNAISNLAPIEGLVQLAHLNLEGNQITNVVSLAGLTSLTRLNLGGNQIASVAALSALTQLTELGLHCNPIASVQPLANMPGLQSLTLFSSGVSDISPLAGLAGLNYLELRWCPLINAETVLAGLTNLGSLYLGGTAVSNLAFLQNHSQLTLLNLDHNNITNLGVLAGLPSLVELDISHNPVTNLAPLLTATNLTTLHLAGNGISDLTQLSAMTGLQSVSLVDNLITNIAPLGALTNLRSLALSRNPLTQWINQPSFTNLNSLWLDGTCISNLDLATSMPGLTVVGIRDCMRRELNPLAGLTKLTTLFADHNFLTNINALQNLAQLRNVELTRNLLDLEPGSPPTTVIATLKSNGASVISHPQNQPPHVSIVPQWFISTNKTSTLTFTVADDIDAAAQISVSAASSDVSLFVNPVIVPGVNGTRSLLLTPASNMLGTATITLTATDLSGSSTNVTLNVAVVPTQEVSITDSNLNVAIHTALNQPGGALTDLVLSELTTLNVHAGTVSNLAGLQWATNLVDLHLKLGGTTNLDGLAMLAGLRSLNIESGSLVDCSVIATLTNLTSLTLKCGQVTNLGFLTGLSKLESLTLKAGTGSSFAPLSGLTNLLVLDLSNNTIGDYPFLAAMRKLLFLDVSRSRLTNITSLTTVTNLQMLSLSHNRLSNISPLTNLPSLLFVDVSLNLLNVPANPTIPTLTARGVSVVSLPQRTPPLLATPATTVVSANVTSQFRTSTWDEGGADDEYPVVTATSSNSNFVFGVNLFATHDLPTFPHDWIISVTPPPGFVGAVSLTLIATSEIGMVAIQPATLKVVEPLLLNGSLLNDNSLIWTSGGGAPWFGQTNTTHDGVAAARSGSIGDSQDSWMQTTVTGPRVLTFWWKVSSEYSFDYLQFHTNGVHAVTSITGEEGWAKRTFNLSEGTQVLRWRYVKDSGYSYGTDAAWLDEVSLRFPATLAVSNLSHTYDGLPHAPVVTAVPGGLLLNITYNGSAVVPTNAGTYALNISVNDPVYGGSATATMTIAKVPLTVAADNKFKPPGFANPPLTVRYSGFVSGEGVGVLDVVPVVNTTATTNSPPGDYPITFTGGADLNYALTLVPGNLLVTSNQIIILSLTGAGTSNAVVTWTSVSNSTYQLQYQPAIGGAWFAVTPDVVATNWTASTVDTGGVGQQNRFYRVMHVGPPPPPVILSLTGATSGNVTVTWSSTSNLTYRVQHKPSFGGGWTSLVPDIVATNSTASAVDSTAGTLQRFYRIMVVP